jgi:hypothetical protein
MMNKILLAILLNLLMISITQACQLNEDQTAKQKAATLFPMQFTKEDMVALANDKDNNQTKRGLVVYKLDPQSKDQFMTYYNAGWVRRWLNGGPAAYFSWQADKQPGRLASYKFLSTYSKETAEIDIIREYDVLQSLIPGKCPVKDEALNLFRLWQFSNNFVQDGPDHRMSISLAKMCFLRQAYAFDRSLLTLDDKDAQDKKSFELLATELENDSADTSIITKVKNGESVVLDKPRIQRLARNIKLGLFIALGVDPELLDQQIRETGEDKVTEKFIALQMKVNGY